MKLTGNWDPLMDKMVQGLGGLDDKFKAKAAAHTDGPTRLAIEQLYTNICAVSTAILLLCKAPQPCSSQVVGSLMRTLIDGCISVFAFCRDPTTRSRLFTDFAVVLKFKGQLRHEANMGSPYAPKVDEATRAAAKAQVRAEMLRVGAAYLNSRKRKNRTDQEMLEEALRPGNEHPSWFRNTWFPESRREILDAEQMGWIDDVFYKWLCSPVHSDAWAGECFASLKRIDVATLAMQLWGAAVWRLGETFRVVMEAEEVRTIRDVFYKRLQWSPETKPPVLADDLDN